MKPNKSCSNNMNKSSKMPCMKAFKVKSLLKPLMNCQRNFSDTLKKKESRKRSKKLKLKDVKDKLRKLVAEMLKKLSEPENSVCMKKSSR